MGLGRFQATLPQIVKLKLQSCIRRIPLHLFVCVPFPCCAQTMPLHAKRKTTAFIVVVMIALACKWRELAFLQQLALPNLWRPCLLPSVRRRRDASMAKGKREVKGRMLNEVVSVSSVTRCEWGSHSAKATEGGATQPRIRPCIRLG